MNTPLIIINDCSTANDRGRQEIRIASLFNTTPVFIPINNFSDIELAGQLVDALDALTNKPGIIIANSAPRHGQSKKWENGTPFCYFYVNNTLIVSTVDGLALSLLHKLNLIDEIYLVDITTTLDYLTENDKLDILTSEYVKNTQFRSYEFAPRLAKWIHDGEQIPYVTYELSNIPNSNFRIWHIDGFGNCKTTILPEDIGFEPGTTIKYKSIEFNCYKRLKDVPNGEQALIIGSSGIKDRRFIEIVAQGKNAAEILNLKIGDDIFIE